MAPVGILFSHCNRLSSEDAESESTYLSDDAQDLRELGDSEHK